MSLFKRVILWIANTLDDVADAIDAACGVTNGAAETKDSSDQ
jgi:hypothetical protein